MTAAAAFQGARAGDARVVAALLLAAAAAWAVGGERMAGMDGGPGTELGGLGWFAVSWLIMMAAMMLPAVAPMVAAYGRRTRSISGCVAFVAAYLGAWVAAGLTGYAAIEGVRSLELGFLAWDEAGRYVAAAAVIGAALYQLTTAKAACLRRCRKRAAFLEERSRPGRLGAIGTGAQYGGECIRCCWAMMVALFAVGVMSLTWMAVVAALIAAERLLPWNVRVGVAVVLVVLGAGVAVAPGDLPGLTLPGSAIEMH